MSVSDLLDQDVHTWLDKQQRAIPAFSADHLMRTLAARLGLTGKRQLYRYLSGETPFPAQKVPEFCRAVDSMRVLQALNLEAGLIAEALPDVSRLDGFDLVDEQNQTLQEFSEFTADFAASLRKPPARMGDVPVEKDGREALQQIVRLLRIYRELSKRKTA